MRANHPTLSIVLRTNYTRADDTHNVAFRLTINRVVRFEASGYAVKPNQFREGMADWIRKHPDQVNMNANLELRRRQIADNIAQAEAGTLPMAHKAIFLGGGAVGGTIGTLLFDKAKKSEQDRSKRVYRRALAMRRELIECWGADLPLSAITVAQVEKLITWLKKRNNLNTTKKKLSRLAGLIDLQIRSGQYSGINPFALVHVQGQDIQKAKLTWDEISAIEKLPLTGLTEICRDLFLFSFYAHGMRFADCVLFTREAAQKAMEKSGIDYQTGKNKARLKVSNIAPLEAIILKYLQDNTGTYLFPLAKREYADKWDFEDDKNSLNTLVNTYLKKIAIYAEIDKPVSFHIARHSFAHLLKKFQSSQGRSDIYIIQQALGHRDIKTTQMYLDSLEDEAVNKEVGDMFRSREKGKC